MMGDWTFFSNHGHVLVCLARNGRARLRDVADDVGITERAVQKIVKDLQQDGFITVRKQGRCNRYRINRRKTLRHGLVSHCTLGKLLALVAPDGRLDRGMEEPVAVQEAPEPPEPAAEPAPPQTAPEPAPEPEPEPEPESKRVFEPAETRPDEEPKSRSPRPDPASEPLDVEQQGSLF